MTHVVTVRLSPVKGDLDGRAPQPLNPYESRIDPHLTEPEAQDESCGHEEGLQRGSVRQIRFDGALDAVPDRRSVQVTLEGLPSHAFEKVDVAAC